LLLLVAEAPVVRDLVVVVAVVASTSTASIQLLETQRMTSLWEQVDAPKK
jgi:hypothetical protein